jgi:hypothetical protein
MESAQADYDEGRDDADEGADAGAPDWGSARPSPRPDRAGGAAHGSAGVERLPTPAAGYRLPPLARYGRAGRSAPLGEGEAAILAQQRAARAGLLGLERLNADAARLAVGCAREARQAFAAACASPLAHEIDQEAYDDGEMSEAEDRVKMVRKTCSLLRFQVEALRGLEAGATAPDPARTAALRALSDALAGVIDRADHAGEDDYAGVKTWLKQACRETDALLCAVLP